MIEWQAMREAASRFLPKHTVAAAWNHWNLSHVELPMPKDPGAEQETSTAPWSAAWLLGWWRQNRGDAWLRSKAAGSLSWIGVEDPSEEQRLQADHATRVQESANFQLGGPEMLTGAHDPAACVAEKRRLSRPVVHG